MKTLTRKLMRDIGGAKGQSLAVIAVVMCGIACYVTIASAHRNLLLTRDTYYAKYRLADFFISLERAPANAVFRIEAIPGVREARGRIVKDVNLDIAGFDESRVGRLISMPDHSEPVLNDICLISGRYFSKGASNEVILSEAFARENHLDPGDSFKASINNKKHTLRVVGTALSPEYVYLIRSVSDLIPNPQRFGILWVPQTFAELAFDLQGACNDIVGSVDNEKDLDRVLDEADKILDTYGLFAKIKRKDQISNNFLTSEIQGLGVTARIVPTIFLGVAAMVLLVLLNRMVRQERTQIGLLKAYGYSNWRVSFHYIEFALVLGLTGCVLGFALGQLLAHGLIKVYVQFYEFPLLRSRVYPVIVLQSAGLTVLFAVGGALAAARRAARTQPAEAMRPETPRTGTRTLFERIAVIWRNLSFTWKMIIRNTSRYKFRAVFTVLGVMVSAATLFVGWFMMDITAYLVEFQFTRTQLEDVRVNLTAERGKAALYDFGRMAQVRRAEPQLLYPFEARHGWRRKDIGVTGLRPDSQLLRLIDIHDRPVNVGDSGLVLDERLAGELGVRPGDTITMKPLLGRFTKLREVTVSKVIKQYLGMGAYMNFDALSRIIDEPFAMNSVLLRTAPGAAPALDKYLKDVPAVAAVELKEHARMNFEKSFEASMQITNVVVVLFAGVIAFSVIYNTTLVSLKERQRELASLRVMGFSISEVGRIVYNENFLLSALGLILGLPLGAFLSDLIRRAYDTDLFRLPFIIQPRTVFMTVGFTIGFVILANLAARRRVQELDMVEVLKARE